MPDPAPSSPPQAPGHGLPPSHAASLMNGGLKAFRTSVTGEPRGPLCGMGICFECRRPDDPDPHRRTCQVHAAPSIPQAEHPDIEQADVLVVGAGPAGIAAACVASEAGRAVVLLDDNAGRGGQIWRGDEAAPKTALARRWFESLKRSTVRTVTGARVVGGVAPGRLVAEVNGQARTFAARAVVLATGARELFLPFPGWTHPQVVGAGGIQALAKSGLEVRGRRILVAGSGPLLLAVAHNMRSRGATVPFIAEQADRGPILRFGLGLALHPGKLFQALSLQAGLLGVPHRTGCWPVRVVSEGAQISVTFRQGNRTFAERCDILACGWGLVPNTELPQLFGCDIRQGVVCVDEFQQTTRPGVFTAGETTGIAGVEAAVLSGQVAGWAAAGQPERARPLFGGRANAQRFAASLERAFALRPELKALPEDSTLVCRCEDVTFGRLRQLASWNEAKLQTRCGMGPCQGRVCGAATGFLFGWQASSLRPPVFPASVATLGSLEEE